MSVLGVLGGGPADLGREAARRAAREELTDRRYRDAEPPLLARLVGRLIRGFLNLLDRAAGGAPGGRLGLLLIVAVLGLLAAVVLVKLGPLGRRGTSAPLFPGGSALTAEEHRRLAEQAAGAGRFADAVRERLRAVVRELEARSVLEARPGRTAGEVARDAGLAVPSIAAELRRAAELFDEVWYGGRAADATTYATMVAVDVAVTSARLVVT